MPEASGGRLTMDYAGKVAVITGGAAGIGRALCTELAQKGAYVIVVDIEGEKLKIWLISLARKPLRGNAM